jgi:gentisate 1,2-dioxygenase
LVALGAQIGGRGCRGCPTRAIQRQNPLFPGRFEQDEAVAAKPRHLRFTNPQQHGTGNGGIDSIAARLQRLDGGLGGKRVRRGAHSVACVNGGAAGALKIAHVSPLLR